MEGVEEAKALLKGVEWFYHWEDEKGAQRRLELWYRLRVGSQERRHVAVAWNDVDPNVRRRLDALMVWTMPQLPKPEGYSIMGRVHEAQLSFDYLFLHVYGETDHKHPLTVGSCIWTGPSKNDPQRDQSWHPNQFSAEAEEIQRSLVPLAWRLILADVARAHEVPPQEARGYLPLLVYVAYRSPTGERLARSVVDHLSARGLLPWFDQEVIGAGDSLSESMRRGIADSSAAVVIFTPDFRDGKTLAQEIEQMNARLKRDPDFKLIPLRVGIPPEELPPLYGNPRSEFVNDIRDPRLSDVLADVHRGALGLPRKGENGSDWDYRVFRGSDGSFTDAMKREAADLIASCEEVPRQGLEGKLHAVPTVALAFDGSRLVGAGAVKTPNPAYVWGQEGLESKAGVSIPADVLELGYFCVVPELRRKGIGTVLADHILARYDGPCIATTRADNDDMQGILKRYRFRQSSEKTWESERRPGVFLSLWMRGHRQE